MYAAAHLSLADFSLDSQTETDSVICSLCIGANRYNDWRAQLRVLDSDCNPKLKDWVRDKSMAASKGAQLLYRCNTAVILLVT